MNEILLFEYDNYISVIQRKVHLLTSENEQLTGKLSRLEERVAVLERIATDKSSRLSEEIEKLR